MSDNRAIYDEHYSTAQLDVDRASLAYDREIIAVRRDLLSTWARGDVLDLCCGSGAYLPDVATAARRVGLDFSRTMLAGLTAAVQAGTLDVTGAACGDARAMPFAADTFDTVFSFTALYHVPDLAVVVEEIRRILRPGGVAILELGNLASLNTLVSRAQHDAEGWAIPHHVPYKTLRTMVEGIGRVEVWRAFQVLPLYGTPRRLWPLYPLLHPIWKRPLGWRPRQRMLDEVLSSAPGLRRVAFRHLVVVRAR